MAYVRIDTDDKRTKVDMEGTPLSLMGILGTAMEECLATVVADLPALGQRASVQGICETLQLQVMRKLGGGKETDKASEEKKATPKQEEPKRPTPEEVLEMILQLDEAGLRKLSSLTLHAAAERIQDEAKPKDDSKKESSVGYGVLL